MRVLLLAFSLAASSIARAENPRLVRGLQLVDDMRFGPAAKELEAALRVPENDRTTLLRILEQLGVAYSTLNNGAKAAEAFRKLLVLDPEYRLSAEYAPRVMTPFYESRRWVTERTPLSATADEPNFVSGRVRRISLRVADVLRLVREVRFHVKADEGAWEEHVGRLEDGGASLQTDGALVEWWAELIGERDAQLAVVFSATAPHADTLPRPPPPGAAAGRGPSISKLPPSAPPLETARTDAPGHGGVRVTGYVAIGLGAGAAIAGLGFAVSAEDARHQLGAARFDADGRVISLTQVQALGLEKRLATGAAVANTAFIAAGALAIAGTVMWVLGAPADQVAIVPSPGGLSVVGVFR